MLRVFIFLFLLTGIASYAQKAGAETGLYDSLQTTLGFQQFKVFKNEVLSDSVNLVVVIHGDAPFTNPGYQYAVAARIASENDNTVSVAILRPGYTDKAGRKSQGHKGKTTGDNYTPDVLSSIGEVVSVLQSRYKAGKIILVGHSGGAVIAADLMELHPAIFKSSAVLVSCPCDIKEWRTHMKGLQPGNKEWDKPVKSLSPMTGIKQVNPELDIVIIHGEEDEVVPLSIGKDFYSRLVKENKKARLLTIPKQGHEIFLNDLIYSEIAKLLKP